MKKLLTTLLSGVLTASSYAGQFDMEVKDFKYNNVQGIVRIDDFSTHTYVPGRIYESDSCTHIEINGALWSCKDKFPDGEREGRITSMYMRDDNNDGTVDNVYQERSYFLSRARSNIQIPGLKLYTYRSEMNDEQKKFYDNLFKSLKNQLTGR